MGYVLLNELKTLFNKNFGSRLQTTTKRKKSLIVHSEGIGIVISDSVFPNHHRYFVDRLIA